MGLLDGLIAKEIYKGFKGKLLSGTLRRDAASGSAGLDDLGDPNATQPLTWPCQGFTEDYDAAYRQRAGIPETDLKANIFAQSIPGVTPQTDDQVAFVRAGVTTWHQIRKVGTDPATAMWVCQAYVIPEPA